MSDRGNIRVLVVDDHPVVLDGLEQLGAYDPRLLVVGRAATAELALKLANVVRPDVILLDLRMAAQGQVGSEVGLELCRSFKRINPDVRVMFLTSYVSNELVLSTMEAGADGYLLKESDPQRIVQAIHHVLKSPSFLEPQRNSLSNLGSDSSLPGMGLRALSAQERRLLSVLATGVSDAEAAAQLKLSEKTIRNYLSRIYEKLGVHSRLQAVLYLSRHSPP